MSEGLSPENELHAFGGMTPPGYLDWLDTHPEGFVIRFARQDPRVPPERVILHRAVCGKLGSDAHENLGDNPVRLCGSRHMVLEQLGRSEVQPCPACLPGAPVISPR